MSQLRAGPEPTHGFKAVQPSVHRASTVLFEDTAAFRARDWTARGFIYGFHGTPTTLALEDRVAALEHGSHVVLCPSGLNAIVLSYITFLKPGDELLVPVDVYAANRRFVIGELASWGVRVRVYDPSRADDVPFSAATRLLWIEAPGSLTFGFPDVAALVARAQAHGVLTAIDNTWSAGVAFTPLGFGVDLSLQSLSKYAVGSADVTMGAIVCRDKTLHDALKLCAMRMGVGVSGPDAASVLKGLDTLTLRYRAQEAAAAWLIARMEPLLGGTRIYHPARPDNAGHAFWRRDCRGAAGLFSLAFAPTFEQAAIDRFIDALRVFKIGFGWGGPLSLVLPQGCGVPGTSATEGELVRFSVGLEPPEVLLDDLSQALRVMPRR